MKRPMLAVVAALALGACSSSTVDGDRSTQTPRTPIFITFDSTAVTARIGDRLVVTDPKAFTRYSDGTRTGTLRRELLGVTGKGAKRRRTLSWRGRDLPVLSRSYQLSPDTSATQVVARFKDTTPAILRHTLGKGTCWTFASSPCSRKALANAAWKQAFTEFQAELGLKTGHDIWRFRFPNSLVKPLMILR